MKKRNFISGSIFIIIFFLLSVGSILAKEDDFSDFLSEFDEDVGDKETEEKGFWSSFFGLFSDDEEESVDLGEFEEGFTDTYNLLSVEVRHEFCISGPNGDCYKVYYDNKKTNIYIMGYYVESSIPGKMKVDHYKVWRKKFFFDEEIGVMNRKDGFSWFDVYSEDDNFVEGVSLSELRDIYLGRTLIGFYYPKFTDPKLGEDNYIYDGDKRTEYYVKPDLNNLYLIYEDGFLMGGISKNHVLFIYSDKIRLSFIEGLCLTEEKTFEECKQISDIAYYPNPTS